MEKPGSFKLIDGTFTAAEAQSMLSTIVSAKINFHSLKEFSNTVRFGSDQGQSAQRIQELKKLNEELKDVTENAAKRGFMLKIKADIVIEVVSEESN